MGTVPEIARESIECDFLFISSDSTVRSEVNKHLGVFSDFQIENGFYADALGLATVVLPSGWRDRLQPIFGELGETIAYSAEIHDIAVSKLVAGREKDFEFLNATMAAEIIFASEFVKRIRLVETKLENEVLVERVSRLVEHLQSQRIHRHSQNIEAVRSLLRELRKPQ